eukprot:scaffold416_cov329-Pavlova_lutheri.AAC.5
MSERGSTCVLGSAMHVDLLRHGRFPLEGTRRSPVENAGCLSSPSFASYPSSHRRESNHLPLHPLLLGTREQNRPLFPSLLSPPSFGIPSPACKAFQEVGSTEMGSGRTGGMSLGSFILPAHGART